MGLQHKKKFYLRQAIEQYTNALDLFCSDAELNSVLYANRAHVHLLLGNFRNALHDALAAAKANPGNLKVCTPIVHRWTCQGLCCWDVQAEDVEGPAHAPHGSRRQLPPCLQRVPRPARLRWNMPAA